MKSGNYIAHSKKVLALLEFMLKICQQNSTGERAEILRVQLQKCFSNLKIFALSIFANVCLFLSVPVISYITKNELLSLVPIEIPFIDQSTTSGYLTANLIMGVNSVLVVSGTIFCASLYILLINNFSVQVELIGHDFNYLDQMWADKKQSLGYKLAFLRNICMRCQDMDK